MTPRVLSLALLLALAQPTALRAGGTPTLCTSPLMGACFYMDFLLVEEVPSSVAGRSDYLHTLDGVWAGHALNGLTDLWWIARWDAYETSPQGRSVYVTGITASGWSQGWHDERGQPRGLMRPLWEYLTIRIYQGNPLLGGAQIAACVHDCYFLADTPPPIDWRMLPEAPAAPEVVEPPTVSVPEPGSLLLLATGLVGMAAARRRRA